MYKTFAEEFQDFLVASAVRDTDNRPYDIIHPSEILSCARRYKYKQLKYPKRSADPNMVSITELSKAGHEYVEKIIKQMPGWIVAGVEVELYDPLGQYPVRGHCDTILQHATTYELLGIDYKFVGSSSFKLQKKQVRPEYMAQDFVYMWLLNRMGVPVRQWETMLWNKSPVPSVFKPSVDPPIIGHRVVYDETLFNMMYLPRIELLTTTLLSPAIPEREHIDPAEEECQFCEYSNLCWKEG